MKSTLTAPTTKLIDGPQTAAIRAAWKAADDTLTRMAVRGLQYVPGTTEHRAWKSAFCEQRDAVEMLRQQLVDSLLTVAR